MPSEDNDLFQARISNLKQKVFIDEYITITQKRIEDELGITHCSIGLSLFRLLQENANHNGAMKGGKLVPEYYHQEWINARMKEFEGAQNGYIGQTRILNKVFPKIMKREKDNDEYDDFKKISNRTTALRFCYKYFTEKLIPRIKVFEEKYQEGD